MFVPRIRFGDALLAGERAGPSEDCGGPSEDCGGPPGYGTLMAALASPSHPEHGTLREWVGKQLDPEQLDPMAISKQLKALGKRIARSA